MGFLETLTVRIEGESSGLERELDRVVGRVEELGSRLSSVGSQTGSFERIREGLSQAVGPAERLGRQLDQVATKLAEIGRIPVTINANAALATLASLNAGIDATAARLRSLAGGQTALSAAQGFGAPAAPASGIASGAAAIPRLAGGGTVRGPAGWDRVPAWLSAGEFVVSRPTVEAVGLEFLEALNRTPERAVASLPSGTGDSPIRRADRGSIEFGRQEAVGVSVAVSATNGVSDSTGSLSHGGTPGVTGAVSGTQSGERSERSSRSGVDAEGTGGVVHNYGGVTIQVKETVELGRVVGELRRQGVGSRLRRGS